MMIQWIYHSRKPQEPLKPVNLLPTVQLSPFQRSTESTPTISKNMFIRRCKRFSTWADHKQTLPICTTLILFESFSKRTKVPQILERVELQILDKMIKKTLSLEILRIFKVCLKKIYKPPEKTSKAPFTPPRLQRLTCERRRRTRSIRYRGRGCRCAGSDPARGVCHEDPVGSKGGPKETPVGGHPTSNSWLILDFWVFFSQKQKVTSEILKTPLIFLKAILAGMKCHSIFCW